MAARIILDVGHIRDKINRFSFPKAQAVGVRKSEEIIKERKREFLETFVNHPVSREIAAGPNAGGNTLDVSGNLFSFIGFDEGSEPIQDLYEYFERVIKLTDRRAIYNKNAKTMAFKFSLPTVETIKKISDLEKYTKNNNETNYGSGKSWVIGIENGLPGLDYYKFSTDPEDLGGESRSTTGIQRKKVIHDGAEYKPRDYLLKMLNILKGVK